MNWIPLKIYQADRLMAEVETVESKYDNMINEVRCSNEDETQSKLDFLSFREEIEQRIIELDEFYQLNISDSRIGTFEKARNRLAALLEINIDEGNKIIKKNYGNTANSNINPSSNLYQNSNNLQNKRFNFNNQKFGGVGGSNRKSKLQMSSSVMRHSSVRQSGTKFGE